MTRSTPHWPGVALVQGLLVQGANIAVQHLHLHGADRWQRDAALRTQTVCSWLDWQRDSAMRRGLRRIGRSGLCVASCVQPIE